MGAWLHLTSTALTHFSAQCVQCLQCVQAVKLVKLVLVLGWCCAGAALVLRCAALRCARRGRPYTNITPNPLLRCVRSRVAGNLMGCTRALCQRVQQEHDRFT
jgi:hypothetical protein